MAGQQRVLELRHDGGLVAEDAVEQRLAGGDLGHGVAPDLLLDRQRLPAGLAELAEGGGARGHGGTLPPSRACRRPTGPRCRPPSGLRSGRVWTCPARGGRRSPTTTCAATPSSPSTTTTAGSRSPVPGHWRSTPAFADSDGPLIYRTRFDLDTGPEERRHWLELDGHLLPGRRVARRRLPRRPRGLLLPPRLRHHRPGPARRRARAVRRGHLRARSSDRTRQAQHHRRLPALGLHRPRLEPGRALAPGPGRAHRAGAHQPPAGDLPRGRARTEPSCRSCAELDTAEARNVRMRTTVDDRVERESDHGLAGGPTRSTWQFGIDHPRAVVAVGARRPAADRPHGRRCTSTTRSSHARTARTGLRQVGLAQLGADGQRRAAVREGRQPGADPAGAGRRHPRRAAPRRRPGQGGRPRPGARARPRQPARAVRRGRRAGHARVAGLPAAVGLRPQHPPPGHPPGHGAWSTCSATTPRSPCGAATTSRSPSTSSPASRLERRQGRARLRGRPAAAHLEPLGARPAGEAGHRAGRREPPGHPPLRCAAPPAQARRHRQPPLLRLVLGRRAQACRASPRRCRGWCASSASSAPRPCPSRPTFMRAGALARPRLGRPRSRTTRCRRPSSTRGCRRASYATFDEWRGATQDYQATRAASITSSTLRRLKYRPTGGFAMFLLNDAQPAVTWSVLDHDRVAKAGYQALTEACRPVIVVADRLPAGPRGRRASVALDVRRRERPPARPRRRRGDGPPRLARGWSRVAMAGRRTRRRVP